MSLGESLPEFEAFTTGDTTLVEASLVIQGAGERVDAAASTRESDDVLHEAHLALMAVMDVTLQNLRVELELRQMARGL